MGLASIEDSGRFGLGEKQRRQLEKQERRRNYADLAIQSTNNSSIVCKRSVEKLYMRKLGANSYVDESKGFNEYFKYFVQKTLRCSPCINRGYWLRMHAVKSILDSIIAASPEKRIVVINLGCGFDPLPFQLLDPQNRHNWKYDNRLSFLDLDYPDLISRKKKIIDDTPDLKAIIGDWSSDSHLEAAFVARKYILAPCDLNVSADFDRLLTMCQLKDSAIVKIFLAEVSLAYMDSSKADAIIKACSKLPRSHFVNLEPLLPAGPSEPFSKQMLRHFKNNDSPLQSVLFNKTKSSQHERFKNLGFPLTNMRDLHQIWGFVDIHIKKQIEAIEPFDELEEFMLFCHHYVVGHSCNDLEVPFETVPSSPRSGQNTRKSLLRRDAKAAEMKLDNDHLTQRKFGASTLLPSGQIMYTHGYLNGRLDNALLIDPAMSKVGLVDIISEHEKPVARMCHTITSLNNELCVLVGGRAAPNKAFGDVWRLQQTEESQWSYEKAISLPECRYRHASCALDEKRVLIYGGHTNGDVFLVYDSSRNELIVPEVLGSIPALTSSAMTFDKNLNKGVIIGGADKSQNIHDTLKIFRFDHNSNKIELENEYSDPLFKRYGGKALFTGEDKVLIAGGTSPACLFDQDTTIIEVSLSSGQVTLIRIPEDAWHNAFPLMVGFELHKFSNSTLDIFGGGAVCYGFGSVWNRWLRLDIP
ncbi:LAME_0C09076g1_1 [Lachancea meyersii CBS 8951]|uniref:tRNA wybutosine-synthesizing protein 4 n=1 Tax=Lachancea meyersii CBS 8951 TaxID=1266667 RepID=A0A1G4J3S8_9SACH|nr:LAME_0C09076g1_1 [Lachancea meyersii CBS 8951]